MELVLRILTIRNCKEWLKDKSNLVDVVAIFTTFFEVVYVPRHGANSGTRF